MPLGVGREKPGPGRTAGPASSDAGERLRDTVFSAGLVASTFRPGNFLSFPKSPTLAQWQMDCAFPDTSLINMRLAMESRVLGGKWLVIMIRRPASEKDSWCG